VAEGYVSTDVYPKGVELQHSAFKIVGTSYVCPDGMTQQPNFAR